MAIFPYNVRGLGCGFDIELELLYPNLEMSYLRICTTSSVHFYGSVVALLSLKSHKDGAWRRNAFKFLILQLIDLLIYLSHLIPSFFTDS